MKAKQAEVLAQYVNEERPFGPTNAAKIEDSEAAQLLFDRENRIYKSFAANPSIIVGRRGAGKTAYLRSEHFSNQYNIVIECTEPESFARILRRVHDGLTDVPFAEEIAGIWDTLFTLLLFDRVIASNLIPKTELSAAHEYMEQIGIRKGRSVEDVLINIIEAVIEKGAVSKLGVAVGAIKRLDQVTYDDARSEVIGAMRARKVKAILLLDNLEDFGTDIARVAHALTGLLRCVGGFNKPRSPYCIRFCIPAELYHIFLDLSSNPLKDFERHVTLHWHSTELLSIASRRIQLYAELYETPLYSQIKDRDISKRQVASDVFYALMPKFVTNALGFEEETTGYILRHTQSLPRHLLFYLNEIAAASRRLGGNMHALSGQAVREGVAKTESKIATDIFSSFKRRFPMAEEVCKRCIPELPMVFTFGTLHEIFNRSGKAIMKDHDYFDFRSMLVEIGAIGRVIDTTTKYWIGLFEYNAPHRLILSSDDELCLHPIFAGVFNCKISHYSPVKRVVMPHGAQLEAPDEREFPG